MKNLQASNFPLDCEQEKRNTNDLFYTKYENTVKRVSKIEPKIKVTNKQNNLYKHFKLLIGKIL